MGHLVRLCEQPGRRWARSTVAAAKVATSCGRLAAARLAARRYRRGPRAEAARCCARLRASAERLRPHSCGGTLAGPAGARRDCPLPAVGRGSRATRRRARQLRAAARRRSRATGATRRAGSPPRLAGPRSVPFPAACAGATSAPPRALAATTRSRRAHRRGAEGQRCAVTGAPRASAVAAGASPVPALPSPTSRGRRTGHLFRRPSRISRRGARPAPPPSRARRCQRDFPVAGWCRPSRREGVAAGAAVVAQRASGRSAAARWCSVARGQATGVAALAAGGTAAQRSSARSPRPEGVAGRSSARSPRPEGVVGRSSARSPRPARVVGWARLARMWRWPRWKGCGRRAQRGRVICGCSDLQQPLRRLQRLGESTASPYVSMSS